MISEILPDVKKVLDFLNEKKQPIALGSASKNAPKYSEKVNCLISLMQLLMAMM